ncbi:MAG: cation transporter [Fibrobacteres bacterium]|nr:cation transporter [Fibrobacterota bacterium]
MSSKDSKKKRAALLSIISNSSLVIAKLVIGFSTGAVSIISEAIHSAVDLVASVIAYFAVRASGKPADKDHPFGHGKYENLSGAIEALLIFVAAFWIMKEALHKLQNPQHLEVLGPGIIVMAVSAIANILVSRYLFKVGKETDSMALEADAWHLMTDVYTSFGVMAALAFMWIGHHLRPDLPWEFVDPIAALFVSALILKAAWDLTKQAISVLLDEKLPDDEEHLIRQHITEYAPTVRGYHRLRTRKSGGHRLVEFHMLVDGTMSVMQSHLISDKLINSIHEHYPDTTVTIHIEPCDDRCDDDCAGDGCMLSDISRNGVKEHIQKSTRPQSL